MKITTNRPTRLPLKAKEVPLGEVFSRHYPTQGEIMYLRVINGVVNLNTYSYCELGMFSSDLKYVLLDTELNVRGTKRHA